ncbi:hypothetical protein EB796_007236 [Bugula neritina]|uniref:Uncharacterized protein n=1 Tax=Bugula neritina TaxID=10212 RepID=A0A7J7K747_BUGNE|nr:hypothetical protein EB796_007236 [Bugula neritina]
MQDTSLTKATPTITTVYLLEVDQQGLCIFTNSILERAVDKISTYVRIRGVNKLQEPIIKVISADSITRGCLLHH